MPPVEELQAAHKRMSELRDRSTPGEWQPIGHRTDGRVGDAERLLAGGEGQPIGDWLGAEDADLILSLHRTIDAQLELLSDAIEEAELSGIGIGGGSIWHDNDQLPHAVLPLARAINGYRGVFVGEGDGDEMIVPLKPKWKNAID